MVNNGIPPFKKLPTYANQVLWVGTEFKLFERRHSFLGRFECTSMPFGSRLVSGFIAAMKSYVSRLSDAPIRIARRVDE